MDINMNGISVRQYYNGIKVISESPLYILANREGYDFKYQNEFDNHYLNNDMLERYIVEEDGITVISSVEYLESKFFTNISILIDVELDNNTMMNIYRTITETIANVSWKVKALNNDEIYNEVGNYYNTIFVACKNHKQRPLPFDVSLYYQVKDLTQKALIKAFKNINYQL